MLVIRRASSADSDFIGRIHMRAIRESCVSHYTPEKIAAWGITREPEFYLDAIRNKEFYVAEDDGVIVGFGTFNKEGAEIEAVYVSPDVVRSGIGLQILRTLEERAINLGVKELHLEASLNAVGFYERAGYKREKEAKHRLQSGIQIRCVMMKKVLPAMEHTS